MTIVCMCVMQQAVSSGIVALCLCMVEGGNVCFQGEVRRGARRKTQREREAVRVVVGEIVYVVRDAI